MASAPSEPQAVSGRLDAAGRLIAADPELETLQREAGSDIGQTLALPQVAAVAQLARKGIRNRHPAGSRWQRAGTFAVDRNGKIAWRHIPRHAGDLPDLSAAAEAALR